MIINSVKYSFCKNYNKVKTYKKGNIDKPCNTLSIQPQNQTDIISTGVTKWQKKDDDDIIIPVKVNPATLKEGQIMNKSKTRILNRHTSMYFRTDLNWFELGQYLKQKFSSYDKVNSYIWGCSEGQEAYSLAILLDLYFKENSSKFFPIQAKDISEDVIAENEKNKKEGVLIDGLGYDKAIAGI